MTRRFVSAKRLIRYFSNSSKLVEHRAQSRQYPKLQLIRKKKYINSRNYLHIIFKNYSVTKNVLKSVSVDPRTETDIFVRLYLVFFSLGKNWKIGHSGSFDLFL